MVEYINSLVTCIVVFLLYYFYKFLYTVLFVIHTYVKEIWYSDSQYAPGLSLQHSVNAAAHQMSPIN